MSCPSNIETEEPEREPGRWAEGRGSERDEGEQRDTGECGCKGGEDTGTNEEKPCGGRAGVEEGGDGRGR